MTQSDLFHFEWLWLLCWHVHFLVALLSLSGGPRRELAPLVGHEMTTLREDKVLQVQHLSCTKLCMNKYA